MSAIVNAIINEIKGKNVSLDEIKALLNSHIKSVSFEVSTEEYVYMMNEIILNI